MTTRLTSSRTAVAVIGEVARQDGHENDVDDDDYLTFKYIRRRRENGRILSQLRGFSFRNHRCFQHPLAESVRASLWCCLGFWIVAGLIALLVITQGHKITCPINTALCTPLMEYLRMFTSLPDVAITSADRLVVESEKTSGSCEQFEPYTSLLKGPNGKKKFRKGGIRYRRLLFLIGESRAGSTFAYDTLNLHPSIKMFGNEPLYGYSNEVCNNNKMLRSPAEACTFEGWLKALFENSYLKSKFFFDPLTWNNRDPIRYLGTKINIEQIPTEFYHDLARFLECLGDTAVVVHVTRAATIASFVNYQMELPERLKGADLDFTSKGTPQALDRPIRLDPELAADWVRRRETLSERLSRLLEFGAYRHIKYVHLFYEQLQGNNQFSDDRWNAVWGFLGLDLMSVEALWDVKHKSGKKKRNRTATKVHGDVPCHKRISNWEEVRKALLEVAGGTDDTGDSLDSQSILACENGS